AQQLLVHGRAGFEICEVGEINNRVALVKCRVVKAALGQTPDQRHLAAFKPEANTATGAGFLTFAAFTARFAVTRAFAAAEPFGSVPRAGAWPQIMKLQHVGLVFRRPP